MRGGILLAVFVLGCTAPEFARCDGGPVRDGGGCGEGDAGPPDAGALDAGAPDAGAVDAGPADAGGPDAGAFDDRCEIVPQGGCDEGEGCYASRGILQCYAEGESGAGGVCGDGEWCRAGFDCLSLTYGGAICREQCDYHTQCPGSGLCEYGFVRYRGGPVYARHCTVPCDLRTNEGCGEGAICTLAIHNPRPWNTTDCTSHANTAGPLESCTWDHDCPIGYGCWEDRCHRWCQEPSHCEPGETCVFHEEALLGRRADRQWGYCRPG